MTMFLVLGHVNGYGSGTEKCAETKKHVNPENMYKREKASGWGLIVQHSIVVFCTPLTKWNVRRTHSNQEPQELIKSRILICPSPINCLSD